MRHYKSINELPIARYWRVIENQDLSHLAIDGYTAEENQLILLSKAWNDIEVEMMDMFIQDEDYLYELKTERRKVLKEIEASIGDKPYIKTLVAIQKQAEKNKKQPDKFDFYRSIAILQKHLGFFIDPEQMSTRMYYTHYRLMKEESKVRSKS